MFGILNALFAEQRNEVFILKIFQEDSAEFIELQRKCSVVLNFYFSNSVFFSYSQLSLKNNWHVHILGAMNILSLRPVSNFICTQLFQQYK